MSEGGTDRVREILDLALERPSTERPAFVAGAADGDEQVRAEVMSLLSALERDGDALEPPHAAPIEAPPTEPLTGLSFGPYVVGERVGEGGMGVVYATQDKRLGRTVAVKALPPGVVRDPHRRARLEREARLLASLNHPNIASIYGVEDTPRGPVLILEFVPGRTLASEIASRRLDVNESVAIARQIARGLESAHSAGVVHRDLKPANIKVTPEGVVKILDLGISKGAAGVGPALGSDSAVRAAETMPGMIVGTAAYMSPEQARGGVRPVDRRTDLWALGCVVYEMLTGQRVFDGETASDAVAAVLRAEPDWSRLPDATPPSVRRLLARCLQKDPERRLRDAGDAILELDQVGEPNPAPKAPERRWRAVILSGACVALIGATVYLLTRDRPPMPHAPAEMRFSIELGGTTSLAADAVGGCIALSPDGRTLVYAADDGQNGRLLYLRHLDSFSSVPIAGTESGFMPFFSPDGRSIAYCESRSDGASALKRVPTDGGPVQVIAPGLCYGASWGDDDTIVFAIDPGILWRAPAGGGTPVAIGTPPDGISEQHSQPEVLPGSRAALFTCWRREGNRWRPRVERIALDTGERRILIADGAQPRFAKEIGMLVFQQGSSLMAAPMDGAGMALSGETRRVIGPIGGEESSAVARYTVSSTGDLAFVPGEVSSDDTDLAWFGVGGATTTVRRGTIGIRTLRLSPDGTRVAFTTEAPETDLWVLDIERHTTIRLSNSGGVYFPVWTPDGKRIAFEHEYAPGATRIEWTPADASGTPEVLSRCPDGTKCFPTDFSRDSLVLALSAESTLSGTTDVFLVRMAGDGAPHTPPTPLSPARLFLETSADRRAARFSPDGAMIAYSSSETGRAEVYLQPFPSLDRKAIVSTDGGERPAWSGDGSRLFYRHLDKIYAVQVSRLPTLAVSPSVVLIDRLPGLRYDASPDGTRFIMGRPRGEWGPQTHINVVIGAVRAPTH